MAAAKTAAAAAEVNARDQVVVAEDPKRPIPEDCSAVALPEEEELAVLEEQPQ